MALTATATQACESDLRKSLKIMPTAHAHRTSADRPNLRFGVRDFSDCSPVYSSVLFSPSTPSRRVASMAYEPRTDTDPTGTPSPRIPVTLSPSRNLDAGDLQPEVRQGPRLRPLVAAEGRQS